MLATDALDDLCSFYSGTRKSDVGDAVQEDYAVDRWGGREEVGKASQDIGVRKARVVEAGCVD